VFARLTQRGSFCFSRFRMYPMNMAQRSSDPTDPTSTTCAHIGITSFADGGKAGIGDCGGGAGGVNGVGGGGGGGRGGDGHWATAVYAEWTCAAGDPLSGHASKREVHAPAVHNAAWPALKRWVGSCGIVSAGQPSPLQQLHVQSSVPHGGGGGG